MFLLVLLLDVAKDDGHHYINSVTSKILHAFKLTGNFCPICRLCYSDDDWECKMIGCSTCDSWTHSKCENLPGKFYTHTGRSISQCNKILSGECAWCITRDRVGLCVQK